MGCFILNVHTIPHIMKKAPQPPEGGVKKRKLLVIKLLVIKLLVIVLLVIKILGVSSIIKFDN